MENKKILIETIKEEDKYYQISDVWKLQQGVFTVDEEGNRINNPCFIDERIKEEISYEEVILEPYNLAFSELEIAEANYKIASESLDEAKKRQHAAVDGIDKFDDLIKLEHVLSIEEDDDDDDDDEVVE